MKKSCGILLVLISLLLVSFVFAVDAPIDIDEIKEGAERVEEGLEDVEDTIDDPGSILKKTKAEERINKINLLLDENVSWMKYIFYMKPQISWLFAFNIYFFLFFMVVLILNSRNFFFFINKIGFQYLFGASLFIILMVLKFYIGLANILESWRFYIFNVLIPASLWLGVLLVIILIILLIFAFPAVAAIGRGIGRYLETKRKTKQKLELTAGTEAVNKLIDEATKSS